MSKDLEIFEETPKAGGEDALSYAESGLDERIIRAVSDMGFEVMSPIQKAAIPVMMEGKDIIGQAQTGTGKTAAFGIPLLQKVDPDNKHLQAVVLCPTRELAMQAADDIRDFAKYMSGIKVLPVYGGQDISRQIRALSAGVQIVVGTPGRVMDHMRRHTMKLGEVKVLVLDEADEMLDMGFRDDIETILQGMPEERQTALFSATMPEPILQITRKYQNNAQFIKMTPREITVAAIEQAYYRVPQKMKEEVLTRLMDYYNPARSLIFCNTKKMVDQLSESLKGKGYLCDGLHGDLSQNQRDTVMNLFRTGRINILIATDVAARGIDVSGVEAVFNYDIPEDIEYYVHRIGRTGRAGKSGKSFTLVGGKEMYKLREIERICHTSIEERRVPSAKEITRAKSQKVFAEVIDIIESGDITSALEFVTQKVEEGEYTAEQLAAGFMKLKMGADLQDLVLFEKKESKRDRYRRTGERLKRREREDDRDYRGKSGKKSDYKKHGRKSDHKKDGKKSDLKKDLKKAESKKSELKKSELKKSEGKKKDLKKSELKKSDFKKTETKKSELKKHENKKSELKKKDHKKADSHKKDYVDTGIGDLEELKSIYKKTSAGSQSTVHEKQYQKRSSDAFENVGRINIKGEGSTKAWYVGQDSDTMNLSGAEKKRVKAQNKKRSLDYLQDMSDLVMGSLGKRKNREKK